MDYRQVLNKQGFQQVNKPYADPAARMGIGEDEELRFFDMKLQYITKHTTIVIPDENTPAFHNPMNRQGNLAPEDFPFANYLGEAVMSYEGV